MGRLSITSSERVSYAERCQENPEHLAEDIECNIYQSPGEHERKLLQTCYDDAQASCSISSSCKSDTPYFPISKYQAFSIHDFCYNRIEFIHII